MAFNGFVTPQQQDMDDSVSTITDPTDSNFTSPSATPVLTTRSGRKRKIIQYDDGSDFMQTVRLNVGDPTDSCSDELAHAGPPSAT